MRTSTTVLALNALLAPVAAGRQDPDGTLARLVTRAERRTGADADAIGPFIEDFRFLLRRLTDDTGLTPLGWHSVTTDLATRLENRLRVQSLLVEHPTIAEESIDRPVFIVGLPRTGTTLVHQVLAGTRGHRGPRLWELLHTDLDRGPAVERRRIARTRRTARTFMRLAPEFGVIHPLAAERPDECDFLLPHGSQHLARVLMPGYQEWAEQRDTRPDYAYLRRALQVLQHGRPPARWILTSPTHLRHLPVLLDVFPDATILWTHRDPVSAIGSLCSMVEATQRLHVADPDLRAIGRTWLGIQTDAVEHATDARASAPDGTVVDVPHAWYTATPHEHMPRLCELLGATWSDDDDARLTALLDHSDAPRREYDLARYGLTRTAVEDAFGDYPARVRALGA